MMRLFHSSAVLLAISIILSGCSSTSPREGARPDTRAGLIKSRKASAADAAAAENQLRAQAHFATALHHDLNDQPELAFEQLYESALADPSYEPVVIETARRALRTRQTEKAIEVLTRALQVPDASGGLHAWIGLAYSQAGQTNRAIAANQTAIRKTPDGLAAYQNLAHIYLQSGRTGEALQLLDQAARQPVSDPGFLIDLAELFSLLGRNAAAPDSELQARIRSALDRAADLQPSHPLHLQKLGEAYLSLGELKQAERFYSALYDEYPDLPAVRAKLMDIYLRSGQRDKASEQLRALSYEDPTNPQTYLFLAALAMEDGKLAEAAEFFERTLLLKPDLEPVYYELAGIRLSQDRIDEAFSLLEQARGRFKPNFVLEFYTGATHASRKNYSEAIRYFLSAEIVAQATDPTRLNHLFYYQLGSAHERAELYAQAEVYFRKCLELAPNYADAMNYLGYMWAEQGVRLEEARDLTERAVELEPDNAAFLDSLAWVHYKLGNSREALRFMLQAVAHSEEPDATLFDHLGDIYQALNQPEEAREAWKKSLEVEESEEIRKKLEPSN